MNKLCSVALIGKYYRFFIGKRQQQFLEAQQAIVIGAIHLPGVDACHWRQPFLMKEINNVKL